MACSAFTCVQPAGMLRWLPVLAMDMATHCVGTVANYYNSCCNPVILAHTVWPLLLLLVVASSEARCHILHSLLKQTKVGSERNLHM